MKVEAKQRWIDVNDKPARVLAVVEGWVMLRRPGCVPFVLSKKDLTGFWRLSDAKREIIDRLVRRFG